MITKSDFFRFLAQIEGTKIGAVIDVTSYGKSMRKTLMTEIFM